MTSLVGPGTSRYRFQNLVPPRDPEWKTRCIVKVSGVPLSEGEDRKPTNNIGFGGKTLLRKDNTLFHLFVG